jgi:ubiquinone/menaquinone biosynthesis C-methylase UbiE
MRPEETSWDRVATWYDGWVGDRGSAYHRQLAIPATLELLRPQPGEAILDVGGGQGVLAPSIVEAGARYTGVDASPRLIAAAKRRHRATGAFVVGDARRLSAVAGLSMAAYDAAVFLLSIQDMDPLDAVFGGVDWALRPHARVVLLMTHPAFRQPRHSGWGHDESRNLQFRRIDAYLGEMAVPMKSLGGGLPTRSFHRPIGAYVNALADHGFAVDRMLELPDLPPERRPGKAGRAGERAGAEIPLFLALRAVR